MLKKGEKATYYISNVGTCSLSVLDGEDFRRIKEINIDSRPQNIVVDDNNNTFVACDRSNRITCIYSSNRVNQTWDIPNNGNLQVDCISRKLYACNAEEIGIYHLETGERIKQIAGFMAAGCLKLNQSKEELFVLDVLENVIKVFSTQTYKLLKVYKNIGVAPSDFVIEEKEQYIYIANKGLNGQKDTGNISVLNIATGNISYITMEGESVITTLAINEMNLFVANNGLHQIEVIDLISKQRVATIKITLPLIQRLKVVPDSTMLLAISADKDGTGAIHTIDIKKYTMIHTFFLEERSMPYDIGVVLEKESYLEKPINQIISIEENNEIVDNKKENNKKENNKKENNKKENNKKENNRNDNDRIIDETKETKRRYNRETGGSIVKEGNHKEQWKKENHKNILAKEVISTYQEKVIFPEITVNIPYSGLDLIDLEEITFQKCEVIKESMHYRAIRNRKEYSVLEYDFFIPYTVEYQEREVGVNALKGRIEGNQKVTLFLPSITEQLGVEFVVTSYAKLISPPVLHNNSLRFEVSALITTMAVIEKLVCIPFLEE